MKIYNAKSDLMNNFESYKEIYDLNISHINSNGGEDLSDEEKKKILGENAKGFYGFPELEVPEKIINMVE